MAGLHGTERSAELAFKHLVGPIALSVLCATLLLYHGLPIWAGFQKKCHAESAQPLVLNPNLNRPAKLSSGIVFARCSLIAGQNEQVQGLVISLLVMQGARKVPTDRPDVLLIIRCTYLFVQLLHLAVYYIASVRVKKANDTRVLKYQEPAKGFGQTEPGEAVVTTNRDYDLQQITKAGPSMLIGILIMGVMHLKFGYTQPLLIQSIMPLKALYDNPIVQIWIFGKEATGKLERPFKAAPGMMAALNEANQASNDTINREAEGATVPKITEITDDNEKKAAKPESKKDL